MSAEALWQQFESLPASAEASTSAAVSVGVDRSHLLIRGSSGEPVFLLLCKPRPTPRAPVRLKHVGALFDVPFEVERSENGERVLGRYAKISCSAQSTPLHRWFVEVMSAMSQRFPGALTAEEVDNALGSMLELFRQAAPPTTEVVTGLWGELLTIFLAAHRPALVQAWHSNPTEAFDFVLPAARIEVKTTQSPSRRHEFALAQVSGGREDDLVLSVIVQHSAQGLNVFDLAKAIAKDLDDKHAERLWRVVIQTLGTELDGIEDLRYDLDAARASVLVFPAAIVPAPTVPTKWHGVVVDVRYVVSLGALDGTVPLGRALDAH